MKVLTPPILKNSAVTQNGKCGLSSQSRLSRTRSPQLPVNAMCCDSAAYNTESPSLIMGVNSEAALTSSASTIAQRMCSVSGRGNAYVGDNDGGIIVIVVG